MHASPRRALSLLVSLAAAWPSLVVAQDGGPVLLPGVTATAHTKSLADMEKAAEGGDRDAAFIVGERYHHGNDAPVDVRKAIHFYEKAANGGHVDASFRLAKFYEDGGVVEPDPLKAAEYYRTAAFGGVMEAQHNLGAMYIEGTKIKRNYIEGLAWLMVAKRNGDTSTDEELVRKRFLSSNRHRLVDEAHKLAERYAAGNREGSPPPEISSVWKGAGATSSPARLVPPDKAKPDAPKVAPSVEKIAPPKIDLPAPKP